MDPIQLESPQANINRARYASKDFFTFVDDIVARIQALFVTEFNDFVVSGTGMMLIDIVSWSAETLSFYIDRQATESYISTARSRKSVVRLARQLGYKVAGSVAASADLYVNLGVVQAVNATIPVGFQWKGPNSLIFEAVEARTYPAGEGPASTPRKIGVRQLRTRVEIFTSNGAKSQVLRLSPGAGQTIAAGSVVVRVAGSPWAENGLITFDQTDQYETGLGDEPPTVRFGNGVAGNIPPVGSEIRVEYAATFGSAGLVQSGTITEVVSPFVVGATVVPLITTNPQPSSGGSDQESLDSAKANAPRVFRAHTVAITRDDYESLAGAYTDPLAGSVAVAQAFVARSADDDLQLQILLNNIRAITAGLAADVQVQTVGIAADATSISASRAAADGAATGVSGQVLTAGVAVSNAKTSSQLAKNKADQIVVDAADITALVVDGKAEVDASSATPVEMTSIKGFFDLISAEAANIAVGGNGVTSDVSGALSQLSSASEALDAATTQAASVSANLASMVAPLADIQSRVLVIDGLMASSFSTAIESELEAIFSHVDGFLAADCQANLIQVPILTRDANGFLTAPPVALIRSLQAFLDERMEVTQDPEVVSGETFLVRAVVIGKIGVLPGFIKPTVLSNVQKAIDNLLRVRAFGASLWLSDLHSMVDPNPLTGIGGVPGVKYAVLSIDGPAEFVDGDGNLIITNKQVITKGSVALTAETAAA